MRRTWLLILGALAGVAVAGFLNRPLLARRQAFLPAGQTDLREAPPLVAFTTVALGGFRGILADLLWMRVSTLQDEGRFFEISQLADWITRLEPTFSEVWSYHAWNMAYNIGILFDAPADRWRWVETGLRLLRDGGLHNNPRDPRLHWELGWMFLSKLGGNLDGHSHYYRYFLYADIDAFQPGGRLDNPGTAPRAWRERYRMDPEVMVELDREHGPFDWRLPESHAIYWAHQGTQRTPDRNIPLERLLYQAEIAAAFNGRAILLPERRYIVRLPRPDLFEVALRVLDEARIRVPDDEGLEAARRHFLVQAVVHAHARSRDDLAARLLEVLRRDEPSAPSDSAAFTAAVSASGRLAVEGILEQIAGLLFEAALAGGEGRAAESGRLEQVAEAIYRGLAAAAAREGLSLPEPFERMREQGRQAAASVSKKGTP